jgi:phytoene dehydrogenase-like protein
MLNNNHIYDVIIVGGGIAGLTSAAYLSKYGYQPLVIEQQENIGGLINSFDYKGFTFDGGIRSIESSGVVKPMMRDLGLNLDFRRSHVTLGIKNTVIKLSESADIKSFESLLVSLFPKDEKDIHKIVKKIYRILSYMDVLYGIDNPMIVDIKSNPSYVVKTLFPWFFKFVPTLYHIEKLTVPVESYLKKYTQNQALIDMIAQHFFKETPAFFALGYFSIYFDYHYPQGGTGELPKALENYILNHGGKIIKQTKISSVSIESKSVEDTKGNIYPYKKLIWAADLKALYNQIDVKTITNQQLKNKISLQIKKLENKTGAESVLTVYALSNLSPEYFKSISSEHFFYTPSSIGLSQVNLPKADDMETLIPSLKQFLNLNTYEISIPVLRDDSLAPKHQTGLIISILFDYAVTHHIEEKGYYSDFKSFIEKYVIEVLSNSIYPTLNDHILETFCSTPLTFKKRNGSTDGAIIGWAYTNKPIPVGHKMSKITKSIKSILPDVYQAGQWSFSPAGVPISVITGKLAADSTNKYLKKFK